MLARTGRTRVMGVPPYRSTVRNGKWRGFERCPQRCLTRWKRQAGANHLNKPTPPQPGRHFSPACRRARLVLESLVARALLLPRLATDVGQDLPSLPFVTVSTSPATRGRNRQRRNAEPDKDGVSRRSESAGRGADRGPWQPLRPRPAT